MDLAAGKSELIAHTETTLYVKLAKNVETNKSLNTFFEVKNADRIKAELNTVALIARRNLPLNFLDHLMETLHFVAGDSKAIASMTCNRTKGTYLLTKCLAVDAHETLKEEMKKSKGFSILCDKATYITMDKISCVNLRFVESENEIPVTKLYRLMPVGKDGGADALFELLKTALQEDGIGWDKVVGYASDGENLMQGKNNSFLTRMKSKAPNLYVLKCYCHSFHLVAGHAGEVLSKSAE